MNKSQTLEQEAVERIVEVYPGLAAMPKMVATVDQEKLLADSRSRISSSHRMHRTALGLENDTVDKSEQDEDDTRFIIAGDVYGDAAAKQVFGVQDQPAPAVAEQPKAPKASVASKLGTAATIAALVLGGGGLGAGLMALLKPAPEQPAVEATADTDTWLGWRLGEVK